MGQNVIIACVRFFITKCDIFITNCDSYYKMRCLLQNVSVHGYIKLEMPPSKNKSHDKPRELVLHFLVFNF